MKKIIIWLEKILLAFDKFSQKIFGPILKKFPNWLTPNIVSSSRIILLGLIIYFYLGWQNKLLVTITTLIAGITDYIDGLLARVKNQVTDLGKIMDRSIDKVFTIPMVVLFLDFSSWLSLVPIFYITIETIALIITLHTALYDLPLTPSNVIGKIKFIIVFIAILLLPYNNHHAQFVEIFLILPATLMASWSLLNHKKRQSTTV